MYRTFYLLQVIKLHFVQVISVVAYDILNIALAIATCTGTAGKVQRDPFDSDRALVSNSTATLSLPLLLKIARFLLY
jgi:hypothetical protein